MKLGERVKVTMYNDEERDAQVIGFHLDMVILAGDGEMNLCNAQGRSPLGLCVPRMWVKAKEKAK